VRVQKYSKAETGFHKSRSERAKCMVKVHFKYQQGKLEATIQRFSAVVESLVARPKLLNVEPVSAGMGDRLRAGIPPRYVTKPTMST